MDLLTARAFRRHQAEIGHELARAVEATHVADLGDKGDGRMDHVWAASATCRVSRSSRLLASSMAWRCSWSTRYSAGCGNACSLSQRAWALVQAARPV